ncbi:MAG: hypothetical protein ABI461_11580 [Polyangiaceae bacterium]
MRRALFLLLVAPVVSVYACTSSDSNGLGSDDDIGPGSDASTTGDGSLVDSVAPSSDGSVMLADGGRDLGTDTTKFFGVSRCATAGVLLCDGFENATLDTATWKVSGDTPVVDNVHAARGNTALHITKHLNGQSYIKETKTFPIANNSYFGRAFVWFEKLPVPEPPSAAMDAGFKYSHWSFVAASGTVVDGEIRLSGQLSNGANHFGVGTDNRTQDAGTGDWTNSDDDPTGHPLAVPTGKWVCVEWQHSGATNETRFYWDGAEHTSLYTSATKHGGIAANPYILPQFTNVWIGWQEYQPTDEDFEMWVDEVAIDTARIGCVL